MKKSRTYKEEIRGRIDSLCRNTHVMLTGLTGGIATGKSAVSDMFKGLGAWIIDFDVLARRVVEPGRKSWDLIAGYFGESILNSDKTINRKKLSAIVFQDPIKREKLESFTHPYIWETYIDQVRDIITREDSAVIIAAIPLLIEGGMQDIFARNIIVYAPRKTQIKRLLKRDNISMKEAEKILASQMPIDEKLALGDYIIYNSGTLDETEKQAGIIWADLKNASNKQQA